MSKLIIKKLLFTMGLSLFIIHLFLVVMYKMNIFPSQGQEVFMSLINGNVKYLLCIFMLFLYSNYINQLEVYSRFESQMAYLKCILKNQFFISITFFLLNEVLSLFTFLIVKREIINYEGLVVTLGYTSSLNFIEDPIFLLSSICFFILAYGISKNVSVAYLLIVPIYRLTYSVQIRLYGDFFEIGSYSAMSSFIGTLSNIGVDGHLADLTIIIILTTISFLSAILGVVILKRHIVR